MAIRATAKPDLPPKTGRCCCGRGEETNGHFHPGHDTRARAMLAYVTGENTAVLLALCQYGPAQSLYDEAVAKRWTNRWRSTRTTR